MYRIKEENETIIEIEKSKFITYLNRVFSEQEAKDYLYKIQKLHPNATHHCYAFLIGEHDEIQRSNDNGEPSGTAGVPMLECLRKNHMQDIIAITVRYFGGIKLGAGGLIRAYSKSVSNALSNAHVVQTTETNFYELKFSYEFIGKLDYYFSQNNIHIDEKEYESDVVYHYQTTLDILDDIAEITSGKFSPTFIKKDIIEVEVIIEEEDNGA